VTDGFPASGWFRFRDDDLDNIQQTVSWMRDKLQPFAVDDAKALLLRIAMDEIDFQAVLGKATPISPLATAERVISARIAKMAKSGERDPEVDWTSEVTIIPQSIEGTVGIVFAERVAWVGLCMTHPNVEPRDPAEPPGWLQPIPLCLQGLSATITMAEASLESAFRSLLDAPSDMTKLLPPWDRRLGNSARFLILREEGARNLDDIRRIDAFLRTQEGQNRAMATRKKVGSMLQKQVRPQVIIGIGSDKTKGGWA
jgi:hypothetical protein